MSEEQTAYQWTGEVAPLADILDRVRSSGSYVTTADGTSHEFAVPTREDYEVRLREGAILSETEDWVDRPDLMAAVQAHWHAAGHTGCMFASHLAEHRLHYGWETWVIRGQADPVVDAAAIDGVVAPRLTDPAVDIVSIVLPAIEQSTQLEAILIALALNPAWQLHEQDVEDDSELGSVRPLGLTVALEFDHCSEVLGFGPGAPLAYTRRAPFTELAIRAKAPAQRRPDRRSNMADIDIDLDVTPDSLAGFYHETKRQRRARLGDEHDRRGKARVTTVVPITKGDLDQ